MWARFLNFTSQLRGSNPIASTLSYSPVMLRWLRVVPLASSCVRSPENLREPLPENRTLPLATASVQMFLSLRSPASLNLGHPHPPTTWRAGGHQPPDDFHSLAIRPGPNGLRLAKIELTSLTNPVMLAVERQTNRGDLL